MTVTLLDAMTAVDARQDALIDDPVGGTINGSQAQLLIVGFDLNAQELDRAMLAAAAGCIVLINTGKSDTVAAIRGTWLNGLVTGLMLAQMRLPEVLAEREAVRDAD